MVQAVTNQQAPLDTAHPNTQAATLTLKTSTLQAIPATTRHGRATSTVKLAHWYNQHNTERCVRQWTNDA